jgi:hypothetical protein
MATAPSPSRNGVMGSVIDKRSFSEEIFCGLGPITLIKADSASEECSATSIGPQPDERRFLVSGQFGFEVRDQVLLTRGRRRMHPAVSGRQFKRYVWLL